MNLEEVEITINKNGEVEIHVRGAKGKECLALTADLEESLGGVVISREWTPEALEENPAQLDETQKVENRAKK